MVRIYVLGDINEGVVKVVEEDDEDGEEVELRYEGGSDKWTVNGSQRTCDSSTGVCKAGSGIQGQFNLSNFEDGILSSAFMVGLLIASPIFASLAKTHNPFRLIGVGLSVWTLATAGCGASFNFWTIAVCRMLVGVGEASFISLAAPFIDDNAPAAKKTAWLAIFYMCIPTGIAVGYVYGGLFGKISWRYAFFGESILMLPFAVLGFVMDCSCGARDDDGERMVSCDICEVWQHTRCGGIDDSDVVPLLFLCERCAAVKDHNMAMTDVIRSCLDSIRQISEHIEDAILYLDAGCTEAFQFLGAFPLLLELGVRGVCSLENASSLDTVVDWNSILKHEKKIVVITSRLLSDAHRYILRCLSMHQVVLHCTIFTSISEIGHSAYVDSPLGPDAFREYESLLLQDYDELVRKSKIKDNSSSRPSDFRQLDGSNHNDGLASEDEGWSKFSSSEEEIPHPDASPRGENLDDASPMSSKHDGWQQLLISVHHFPMILCPLSPTVFVLPSEGTVAEACLSYEHEDSFGPGLPTISTGLPSDGEDTPPGAILTANLLYHLATKMDLKMEIFSLGDLSKNIGKIMMDMSSLYDVGRRKKSAGLLLIDRTLDLLTPCCHGDSLVDRMFSSLPRRQRTSSLAIHHKHGPATLQRAPLDVQIPLGTIFSKEEPVIDATWPTEGIEAFLSGWSSSDSGSQTTDLTDMRTNINADSSVQSDSGSFSGSLVSIENHHGAQYLEALLDRRTKDGAILVKKWLQESLRKEKISLNLRTRPSFAASELYSMVKALTKDQSFLLRNKGIIQLAVAAAIALSEPYTSRWDAFISAERILSVSAGDTSQSLSAQIRDLINRSVLLRSHEQKKQNVESSQGLFSFQDALLLAIIGYILAGENFPTSGSGGPFSWEEEHFLKESIVDAILENPAAAKMKFFQGMEEELEANLNNIKSEKPKEDSFNQSIDDFDDDQWGNWGDEDTEHNSEQVYGDMQLKLELRDRVDNLFKVFHKLSSLKTKNVTLRNGLIASESNFSGDLYMGKGLLYKLLTMVLGKYEVPGLEYHSSAVGRLFKSGFGRFGLGQAKPSLGEQSVILVFVVGGISCQEVLEIREALAQSGRPDIELIIGGTTLLTPDDMFDLLLGS